MPAIPGWALLAALGARLRSLARGLFHRDDVESEIREEFQHHVEMRTAALVRTGVSAADAALQARREFGHVDTHRADARESRGFRSLDQAFFSVLDVKLALRALRHRPLFTAVAIITFALGIGATTTLFTIVNAVLLRPLPYAEANRIVSVSESEDGKDHEVTPVPDYFAWRHADAFSSLAMYGGTSRVVRAGGSPKRMSGASVSASFFSVFGARPALGRTFASGEDTPNGPSVVLLSHALWLLFGGDSSVVGKAIALDDHPMTVVGVMPAGFAAPRAAAFWVPMQMDSVADAGVTFYAQVAGRLKPGATLDDARAQLAAILVQRPPPAVPRGMPKPGPVAPVVMTLHERMFGSTRPALLMLLGAVGFLLLIACANVANLLLARGASRQREFAVRVALGASRWRLVRQLLCESLAVSLTGAGLGLLIPLWTVGFFVRLSPASVARVDHIGVDGGVLAFTAGVSLLTGVLFGLVPAFAATRPDALQSLKEGGTRSTSTSAEHRIRQALVVVELGTALVLLTGAGLLTRSFARALAVDVGFEPAHALSLAVHLTRAGYPNDTVARAFFDRLASRVRALPAVQSVGYADAPALGGYHMSTRMVIPQTNEMSPPIAVMRVSADFMTAFGSKLVAGRLLDARDGAGAAPVVVLSENAARALIPGRTALGGTMPRGMEPGSPPATVVGIVRDIQEPGLDAPRLPQIYQPIAQVSAAEYPYLMAVRYTGEAAELLPAVRRITSGFDPMQVDVTLGAMQDEVDRIVAPRRFDSVVINVFAALALVLAAVGLYGVMAYQVTQRTRELGIRMALGADRMRMLRFVVGDGLRLTLTGSALGVALSLALSRFVAGMLFGVSAHDPFTYVAVPAVLIAVALGACYLPAWRATQVDPTVALRHE